MGVTTIGELAALPLATLQERFGRSHGEYLYAVARGLDDSPLVTAWEPRSLSREVTFQHDVGRRQVVIETLQELTGEVAETLRQEGYQARTVTVKVRFWDFETHTRAQTLPAPTDDPQTLREAALAALNRLPLTKWVRLIRVRLGGLVKVEPESLKG